MQLANLTACEEPLNRALVLDLPVEPHAATAAATAKPTVTGQIEAWTRPRRQQPARRVRRDRRLGGITALVIRPRIVVATCMCTLCGAADNTAVTASHGCRLPSRPQPTYSPTTRRDGSSPDVRFRRKPPPRPQRVAGAPTRSLRCSRRCRCGHAFATNPIVRESRGRSLLARHHPSPRDAAASSDRQRAPGLIRRGRAASAPSSPTRRGSDAVAPHRR